MGFNQTVVVAVQAGPMKRRWFGLLGEWRFWMGRVDLATRLASHHSCAVIVVGDDSGGAERDAMERHVRMRLGAKWPVYHAENVSKDLNTLGDMCALAALLNEHVDCERVTRVLLADCAYHVARSQEYLDQRIRDGVDVIPHVTHGRWFLGLLMRHREEAGLEAARIGKRVNPREVPWWHERLLDFFVRHCPDDRQDFAQRNARAAARSRAAK